MTWIITCGQTFPTCNWRSGFLKKIAYQAPYITCKSVKVKFIIKVSFCNLKNISSKFSNKVKRFLPRVTNPEADGLCCKTQQDLVYQNKIVRIFFASEPLKWRGFLLPKSRALSPSLCTTLCRSSEDCTRFTISYILVPSHHFVYQVCATYMNMYTEVFRTRVHRSCTY